MHVCSLCFGSVCRLLWLFVVSGAPVFIVIVWAIVKSFALAPIEPQVSIAIILFLTFYSTGYMPLKAHPKTVTYCGTRIEIRRRSTPCDKTRDTRVMITLVVRPLITPAAQKLWRCEHAVCVYNRILLSTDIFCRCSSVLTMKYWIGKEYA
jgi:hypothetical protein